jgi:hypothetical protein
MADHLPVRRGDATFSSAVARAELSILADHKELAPIQEEAVKHGVAIHWRHRLAELAQAGASDLHENGQTLLHHGLIHTASLQNDIHGSPELLQQYFEASSLIFGDYTRQLRGTTEIGAAGMALEAGKDLDVPRKKRGWFR